MRILVYPHELSIGGSQINAIDLAANAASSGHDVWVYGIPGPLVEYIEQRGLRFIAARPLKYRPAPSRVLQLASIARDKRIDLIHAYEWPPCLDAYFGARLVLGVPVLCTVLSMTVSPLVPKSLPLIMGTDDLGDEARLRQKGPVWVLEPPIDVASDNPLIDGTQFRHLHNVGADELLIVSVSRLAIDLKLDALVDAIDAADQLASKYPVRLILVGDGGARDALLARAQAVNRRWGREVVSLPGSLMDPRPAYAAADVVVGMGSSALRALAIARPVVVQGERGFSQVFEDATLPLFLRQGFFGQGSGRSECALAAQLSRLLDDAALRMALGCFGRHIVETRFSLQRATSVLLDIYEQVVRYPDKFRASEAMKAAYKAVMVEVANHDPRRKRAARVEKQRLLSATASLERNRLGRADQL